MKIKVSIGEVVDKLSILDIKRQRISDAQKLVNVLAEYEYLCFIVFSELNIAQEDYNQLLEINTKLWDIEDSIRIQESQKVFDEKFVSLARSVYIVNDKRAEVKKYINIKYKSSFIEEKSYEQY